MKLSRVVPYIFVGLFVLAGTSCSFRDDKNAVDARVFNASQIFGYNDVKSVVFAPHCLSCHGSQKQPFLNTYAEIKANIDKIQTEVLVKNAMPPRSPLPSYERQVLQAWIAQGAPEVGDSTGVAAPSPTPMGPIDRPVKWDVVRKNVFEPKCFNCHYHGNPDGYTDYTDVSVLKDTMGTILFLTITQPQMPPAPDTLTQDQKDLLAEWVIDGMNTSATRPTPSPGASPVPTATAAPSPAPSAASSPLPPASPAS